MNDWFVLYNIAKWDSSARLHCVFRQVSCVYAWADKEFLLTRRFKHNRYPINHTSDAISWWRKSKNRLQFEKHYYNNYVIYKWHKSEGPYECFEVLIDQTPHTIGFIVTQCVQLLYQDGKIIRYDLQEQTAKVYYCDGLNNWSQYSFQDKELEVIYDAISKYDYPVTSAHLHF